ncbi:MAG TPA: hypothetical protein VKA91_06870 [Nitrososphaeraceae archaeon]|jgi:hypothetical protein|nr:hypothetical protein [Nitrososphaeraceae archaeon]
MVQIILVKVFDSARSLRSKKDVPFPDAKVMITVLYPSVAKDHFEDTTDEEGMCRFIWNIGVDSKIDGEGKVIAKISKGINTSSEITKTFQRTS